MQSEMQDIDNSTFWVPSGSDNNVSEYYHKNNKFIFKTIHGEPGPCVEDSQPEYYKTGDLKFTHKERCETKSQGLQLGDYIWSADIELGLKSFPRNACLHQIHWEPYYKDGTAHKDNYIKFGINHNMNFIINDYPILNSKFIPTSYGRLSRRKSTRNPFTLTVKIECRQNYVNVDYFYYNEPNEQYIGSYRKLITELPYMKFGIYVLNSSCDITHIYNNVRVRYKPQSG